MARQKTANRKVTRARAATPPALAPEHAEVDNESAAAEAAAAPVGRPWTPRIEHGGVGSKTPNVSRTLDGTGLELLARRVLARRGQDASAVSRLRAVEVGRAPVADPPLRDVVEAGLAPSAVAARSVLPGLAPETVIGADDRMRVFDTHLYPYSAIAALEITARDGSRWIGTAWYVSSRTLITAGHCVFIHAPQLPDRHGWVREIRVIPGRNGVGPDSEPFGFAKSSRFRSVSGWVSQGSPEFDYGAILLDGNGGPTGDEVGMFGVGAFPDADLELLDVNVAGYPGDRTGAERQTLWYDAKRTASVAPRQVFYDVDTFGGQSGAPVYIASEENRIAVAVHAYGTAAGITSNSGTRITEDVLQRILTWKT